MMAPAAALLGGAAMNASAGHWSGAASMGRSGLFMLACAGSSVYTTRVGKFRE